jgi:hypothetical protein
VSADDLDHQVLRLWAARLVRRHGGEPAKPRTEDYDGRTAAQLADLVESLVRADQSTWLVTHNLNYDLAVTELPVLLTSRGWRMTEGALTTADPWCRFAKGRRRLTIVDSWSYMPKGLEAIGLLLGRRKLALPDWDAPDSVWLERCQRDVDITAEALEQLMSWWDAGAYGNWSLTGPSTGWSSYRHRRPAPRVLVEPDPAARALEQRAVTGGRRTTTRLGQLPVGLYADLDLTTAHLTVMGNYKLPMRRIRHFDQLDPGARELRSTVLDVLAECVVTVQEPRYPWDSGHGLFYPTGTFSSVLAGPEIRAAMARGELVSIGQGYVYTMADHMADWAHWLAGLLADDAEGVPPMVQVAAKHWSRCVPGKWAGHTSEVISRVPDPRPGWSLERGWLVHDRRPADFLLIGGELWTIRRDDWAEDAFPAVLAWIQSHTRLALARFLELAGPAAILCNTDGALVDVQQLVDELEFAPGAQPRTDAQRLAALAAWCEWANPELAPFVIRPKGATKAVTVLSPQHLLLDKERRLAGVPRSAVALGDLEYSFTAWPKLALQLVRQRGPGYTTAHRKVDLGHIAPAGWLTEGGDVVPPTIDQAAGPARVLPPTFDTSAPGQQLAPISQQHQVMRRVLADSGWAIPPVMRGPQAA